MEVAHSTAVAWRAHTNIFTHFYKYCKWSLISEHTLIVRVKEDAGVVEDQQALYIAGAADISSEADSMLPRQVTQEAESTR